MPGAVEDFLLLLKTTTTTTTTTMILLLPLLLLLQGRINSRMTSYPKIFVLIDFHFQNAIFPFNRAAPYGMTSAVPREQSRTSARSAERPLALDPRPHSSAAARASLRFLVRSATERRTSRGEISFQLPFKRYPIKNFGSNRADKSENFPLRGVHTCLKSRIPSKVEYNVEWPTLLFVI